jgi:3-deoxy-D-manno-octulosonic-acid transferase
VKDATELETELKRLLNDPAARAQLGRCAVEVVRKNQGAVERTVDMIIEHLDSKELYIAR